MKSLSDRLTEEAESILIDLKALLAQSQLRHEGNRSWRGFKVVSTRGPYKWVELTPAARVIQSKVNADYAQLSVMLDLLLEGQVDDLRQQHDECRAVVSLAITQSENMESGEVEEFAPIVEKALRTQLSLISNLYGATDDPIFVPDTNAILHNLDLETWGSLRPEGFTIYIVPTVLQELDKLKVSASSKEFREKVESAIRRLKGYRDRGKGTLREPVKLAGKVKLKLLAIEPQNNGLPWLRPDHSNDDRLLASVLGIMCQNVAAPVVLVTRDINLQTKCDQARVAFVEPPDSVSALPKAAETGSKEA